MDDLCDQHGNDDADSNDSRLAETGGDDFQWLFKMLATMGTLIRIMGTLMRTIRMKGMMRMMGIMGMMGMIGMIDLIGMMGMLIFHTRTRNLGGPPGPNF